MAGRPRKTGRTSRPQPRVLRGEEGLEARLEPFGPSADQIRTLEQEVLRDRRLQEALGRSRHRLLGTELVEDDDAPKRTRPRPPTRFRSTLYDYTHDRCLQVTGGLRAGRRLEIEESNAQPWPTYEELRSAVAIVRRDDELGPLLTDKRVRPYPPMPPLVGPQEADGTVERTIAVGLLPEERGAPHEIVGVNMRRRTVVRFDDRAPETAQAHNPICGLPYSGQAYLSNTPGQVWVTVTQGGTTTWRFLLVRPAGSSGTNGSGVELRYVDYKGKRLLYRAHVPILNVKYDGDACGPYRDRQDREGMFQTNGWTLFPGFRFCSSPAQTVLDSGSDTGNFQGVAFYFQGNELVLVSEMEAGWYRYISLWRLGADGRIRARFGFSAVSSSCVCNVHNHHAYWRFDFDVRTAANNRVREFNDPCLPAFCPSNWHDKVYEIQRPRDPGRKRKWRIDNTVSGEAYDLVPGGNDGVASQMADWPFGMGDVWILRYHGNEIDDGSVAWGPPYEVGMGNWITGESVLNQDVVIWYGAHFRHDVNAEPPGTFGDWVGPDLVPVNW